MSSKVINSLWAIIKQKKNNSSNYEYVIAQ